MFFRGERIIFSVTESISSSSTHMTEKAFTLDSGRVSFVFTSPPGISHFYGYYGTSPWDPENARLLTHRTKAEGPYIRREEPVDVGWFDLESGKFNKFGETTACNWQQGAMLRWVPGAKNTVIYNRRTKTGFGARIVDLDNGKSRDLPRPVHALLPDGTFGLGLNVERLYNTRRAYSYEGAYEERWAHPMTKWDGIFKIDLHSGETSLLLSTEEISNMDPHPTMAGARHWLDHPLPSPDSRRLLFYHRWLTIDGTFFTRLYTVDANGSGLTRYPDSGMYSHAAWKNAREFVVFARPVGRDSRTAEARMRRDLMARLLPVYRFFRSYSFMRSLRRRVLSDRYFMFTLENNHGGTVLTDQLADDGHPSFNPRHPDLMLTDTYPDVKGRQRLLLLNIRTGEVASLGWFKAPKGIDATTPNRCDLHPRWDNSGELICIDTMAKAGNRQICVLRLQGSEHHIMRYGR
jgi:hypothetical protein